MVRAPVRGRPAAGDLGATAGPTPAQRRRGPSRQPGPAHDRAVRLRTDRRTQTYAKKKTAEGKSDREIMRCLKRYIAREMFRLLVPNPAIQAA